MPSRLEPEVRELSKRVHPDRPELPVFQFWANPTLIAVAPDSDRVIGYTSYQLNRTDTGRLDLWLIDLGVASEARGKGVSKELMEARLAIGHSMGCAYAVGLTRPGNEPMRRLFRFFKFDEVKTLPNAYFDGGDGILYMLDLKRKELNNGTS